MYPWYNNNYCTSAVPQQPFTVPSVISKESAMAYPMPNNSSILLLEEQTDHLFFVQTDAAGMKQITTYQLVPYTEPKAVSVDDLNTRMAQMETVQKKILELLGGLNAKPDTSANAGQG